MVFLVSLHMALHETTAISLANCAQETLVSSLVLHDPCCAGDENWTP